MLQLQTMINYTGNSLTIDDSSLKIENGYPASFNDAKQEVDIFTTSSPILVRNCDIQCLTEDYNCNQDTSFVECNTAPSMNYPFICARKADKIFLEYISWSTFFTIFREKMLLCHTNRCRR